MKKITREIGRRIRDMREAQGWTREHLSQLAGIDARELDRIEQGEESTTVEELSLIATAFKVPLPSLCTGENSDSRSFLIDALMKGVNHMPGDALGQLGAFFVHLGDPAKTEK